MSQNYIERKSAGFSFVGNHINGIKTLEKFPGLFLQLLIYIILFNKMGSFLYIGTLGRKFYIVKLYRKLQDFIEPLIKFN